MFSQEQPIIQNRIDNAHCRNPLDRFSQWVAKMLSYRIVNAILIATFFFFAYLGAFALRFDFEFVRKGYYTHFWQTVPYVVLGKMFLFYFLGQYQNICWYYVSIKEVKQLFFASLVGIGLFFLINATFFTIYLSRDPSLFWSGF